MQTLKSCFRESLRDLTHQLHPYLNFNTAIIMTCFSQTSLTRCQLEYFLQ